MIVPRMLGKTAYEPPFEICEMDDPRPHMVLCTAGMAMDDAEAERIGLTAYLRAHDPAKVEAKAVQQTEVEDKAVSGPEEAKADEPSGDETSAASDPAPRGVSYPPEARRQRGR